MKAANHTVNIALFEQAIKTEIQKKKQKNIIF